MRLDRCAFRRALLFASIILFTGCVSSKPPQARYYDRATFEGIGGDARTVDFDLHVTATPSATRVMAMLPERALAALIEAYGDNEKLLSQMPALLAAPIKGPASMGGFDDSLVRFKKRFTFTIVPRNFHPADRLYSATLEARAPQGWRFTGWSGFEPKDRTVDFAKLESVLSQKQNASIKLTPPQIQEVAEASLSHERQRTDTTKQDLSFEVIEFLPRLDDESAELTLNSPFPQVNVAGSYSVDVSFEFASPEVQRFVEFSFEDGDLTDYRLRALRFVPNLGAGDLGDLIPSQVLHDVRLSYIERIVFSHIQDGAETGAATADEGDDIATFRKVEVVRNGGLLNPSDGQNPPFAPGGTVFLESDEVKAVVNLALLGGEPVFFYDAHAHQMPARAQCLVFRDGSQAEDFSAWVAAGSAPRLSGMRKDGRKWSLMVGHGSKRRILEGADLETGGAPFSFRAFVLNNPEQAGELKQLCKPGDV